jgi:hypothetical protein
MRGMLLATIVAFVVGVPQGSAAPQMFDPVGTWAVSTTTDEGSPMKIVCVVTGRPGAYIGQATTAEGRTMAIEEVFTSSNAMMLSLSLPNSSLVVRVARDASGKFAGHWGELEQTFPLTAERTK